MIIKNKTPFGENGCYYELIASPEDKIPFKGNGLLPKDAVVGSKLFLNTLEFTYSSCGEIETWTEPVFPLSTGEGETTNTYLPIFATISQWNYQDDTQSKLKIKIGTPATSVADIANSLSMSAIQVTSNGASQFFAGVDLNFGSTDDYQSEVKPGINYNILYVKIDGDAPEVYMEFKDADLADLAGAGALSFIKGKYVGLGGGFFVPFEGTEDGYDSPET